MRVLLGKNNPLVINYEGTGFRTRAFHVKRQVIPVMMSCPKSCSVLIILMVYIK